MIYAKIRKIPKSNYWEDTGTFTDKIPKTTTMVKINVMFLYPFGRIKSLKERLPAFKHGNFCYMPEEVFTYYKFKI